MSSPARPARSRFAVPACFSSTWRVRTRRATAFREGWFRTGDVGVVEDGCYRILGRQSVDIIKTGGYKVSALEIEEVLRAHPDHRRVCRRRDRRPGVGRAGRGRGHRAASRDSVPRLASGVGAAAARRAQDSDAAARRSGPAAERHGQDREVAGAGAVLARSVVRKPPRLSSVRSSRMDDEAAR